MSDNEPLHLLYEPTGTSSLFQFRDRLQAKHPALSLKSYHDLYLWSVDNSAEFWSEAWDFCEIIGEKGEHVVDDVNISQNPHWFTQARVNWAENMLRCRSSEKVALIQATEPTSQVPEPGFQQCTYAELYDLTSSLVSALLASGVQAGERVAAYTSNCIQNVACCLATSAIGAIWVAAAADFGPAGVLERFEQVSPTFIFAVDAVVYNGRVHDHLPKLEALLSGLAKSNISPKVLIMHTIPYPEDRSTWKEGWRSWDEFIHEGKVKQLGRTSSGEIEFYRTSFNWPLWILFSSGSTGRPKAIVHRAGGMLLQAKVQFTLHADLKSSDVFFYYTTVGWMMWNFLTSALALECTLVLYDGSPLRDPALLWKFTDELKISIFGTSAKYLEQLSKGYKPREKHDLSSLRHIYSTGSPLSAELFDYVYRDIHSDVLLGGTDICSLFAGMCSALPVFRGEVQCRMLGFAVESYSEAGTKNPPDVPGELVCLKPFPCAPAGFWPLPGFGTDEEVAAARAKYHQAYFAQIEGVWYHGDHIVITRSRAGNGGGIVMLGRSDGVLYEKNPGGVRFGSSELYEVIDAAFCSTGKIVDCLAVGQTVGESDERVILFVKLPDGEALTPALERAIREEVRTRRSARHVPAKVIQVKDIPYTLNLKRVEVLVKKIINGAPLSIVNPSTLTNPECLTLYYDIGVELRKDV